MAFGDTPDNTAFAGLIREFAWCPMADRTPRRLRGLTGQGDDLTPLLGTKGGRSAWARGVLEPHGHGLPSAVPKEIFGHAVYSWTCQHLYLYARSRRTSG